MLKFGTIGGFKASNNPRVTCASNITVGQAFQITTVGNNETATAFANAGAVRDASAVWVALNIIDQPELLNSNDFVIPIGDEIRAFKLNDIIGLTVELSNSIINGNPAVNEFLIPNNNFNWRVANTPADVGDYPLVLQVMATRVLIGGEIGILAKIVPASIAIINLTALTENVTANFAPAFAVDTYEYTLDATNAEDEVDITATSANAEVIEIHYAEGADPADEDFEIVEAVSGEAETIPLEVGENIIKIVVKRIGSATSTYTITVTRADA